MHDLTICLSQYQLLSIIITSHGAHGEYSPSAPRLRDHEVKKTQ